MGDVIDMRPADRTGLADWHCRELNPLVDALVHRFKSVDSQRPSLAAHVVYSFMLALDPAERAAVRQAVNNLDNFPKP